MTDDILTKDISPVLGLDELDEAGRQQFLDDIGEVILERAVLNFLLALDETNQAKFRNFLSTAGEGESLLEAIIAQYPDFSPVLQSEIVSFKLQAESVLGAG